MLLSGRSVHHVTFSLPTVRQTVDSRTSKVQSTLNGPTCAKTVDLDFLDHQENKY